MSVGPVLNALRDLKKAYKSFNGGGSIPSKLGDTDHALAVVQQELQNVQPELDQMLERATQSLQGKGDQALKQELRTRKHEIVAKETRLGRSQHKKRAVAREIDRASAQDLPGLLALIKTTNDLVSLLNQSHQRFTAGIQSVNKLPWGKKRIEKARLLEAAYQVANGVDLIIMDVPDKSMFEFSYFTGGGTIRTGL